MRSVVLGGPADGLEIPGATGAFRWIDSDGVATSYARPGAGLYRRKALAYVFWGHRFWVCERCCAAVARSEPCCPACGGARV